MAIASVTALANLLQESIEDQDTPPAVYLWELATGTELRRFQGHTAPMGCVAFPNGKSALSGSEDHAAMAAAEVTRKD